VALLSRTADPDHAARLEHLMAGADVRSIAVDLADKHGLGLALDSLGGAIRGVIHAAGVLQDGAILNQTPDRFREVFVPKALGAHHLHELTLDHPVEFFVGYSSASVLYGTAGQVNYVAANAALDALCALRISLGLPALSIQWGPWGGGGMAARTKTETFATGAAGVIDPDLGIEALERLLLDRAQRAAILPFRWNMVVEQQPTLRRLKSFSRLFSEHTDPRRRQEEPAEASLLQRLSPLPHAERLAPLAETVEAMVAKAIGIDAKQRIDWQRGFMDLGLDSMLSVQLRNELQAATGARLPYGITFNYPNIASLSEFLLTTLFPKEEKVSIRPPEAPMSSKDLEAWLDEELKTVDTFLKLPER
jgi:acyl carrier protein